MTSGHLFYIPIILIAGWIIGFHFGKQAAEKEAAKHNERQGGESKRRRRRREE